MDGDTQLFLGHFWDICGILPGFFLWSFLAHFGTLYGSLWSLFRAFLIKFSNYWWRWVPAGPQLMMTTGRYLRLLKIAPKKWTKKRDQKGTPKWSKKFQNDPKIAWLNRLGTLYTRLDLILSSVEIMSGGKGLFKPCTTETTLDFIGRVRAVLSQREKIRIL